MPVTSPEQLIAALDSFPWDEWRKKLDGKFDPVYRDVVRSMAGSMFESFDFDDPFTQEFMTRYVGERIVQLEAFTIKNVSQLLRRVFAEVGAGGSTMELTKLVRDAVREHVKGYEMWRAQRIARTESAFTYNHSTVLGNYQAGTTQFDVIDGDQDDDCAAANGSTWSVTEALEKALGHPNCTRYFTPAN